MNAQKKEALIAELTAAGRLDERKLYVFNNAKSLPGGSFGLCIVSVSGNTLYISDTDLASNVGDLIAAVPVSEMSGLKASTFPFNPYVKFNWNGCPFHLGGVTKELLAAIQK